MMHYPGGWHGHIGDGHNHVSHTLVSRAPTVGHVVYPLSSFILDKALVLTWIPVIASGINRVSAIDASEHPPVTFNVLHGVDTLEGVTVAAYTGPILWILQQTPTVQHTAHHRLELRVLVAVGHLAEVGAGRHLLLALHVVQHTCVHTTHGLQ